MWNHSSETQNKSSWRQKFGIWCMAMAGNVEMKAILFWTGLHQDLFVCQCQTGLRTSDIILWFLKHTSLRWCHPQQSMDSDSWSLCGRVSIKSFHKKTFLLA